MFAAMMMHLQTEPASRPDFNTLDLEACAFFQDSVGAPWTVHRTMKLMRFMPGSLEVGVKMLYILGPLTICDQNCIRCVDDNKVIDAHSPHDALVALYV